MTGNGHAHDSRKSAGDAESSAAQPVLPRLQGVEHRFLDFPGLRMHVAEAGSGEPVLLLHGFPQHWWEWRMIIPGLAEHYRVICPDLRGAGWTGAPRTGYNMDQLLADVVALMDALNLDRVHLIGHDWGALVGFHLCLKHPDRVRSFMALGVPHPFVRFDPRLLMVLWRLWFQVVIVTPLVGPGLLGKGHQRFARYLLLNFTANRDAFSEEDIELFVAQLREPARARAGSALYRSFIIPEAVHILTGAYQSTRLNTPTRVLYGAEDPGIRPDFLGGYEEHADDLELEFVDGAAHFVADDRPDVVLKRALELFAQH